MCAGRTTRPQTWLLGASPGLLSVRESLSCRGVSPIINRSGSLQRKKPSLPGLRISFTLRRHHPEVDLETAPAPVLDVALQSFVDDGEGQRVPGDVRVLEKLDLQAFGAGAEGGGAHLAAKNHIDLADMRDAEDGV